MARSRGDREDAAVSSARPVHPAIASDHALGPDGSEIRLTFFLYALPAKTGMTALNAKHDFHHAAYRIEIMLKIAIPVLQANTI